MATLAFLILYYKTFTNNIKRFSPFFFVFCFDAKKMSKEYFLSKGRSEAQCEFQRTAFKKMEYFQIYFSSFYTIFLFKMIYVNVRTTFALFDGLDFCLDKREICLILVWFLIAIKLIVFSLFYLVFYQSCFRFPICFYEYMASVTYLSNRLDDLSDKISQLFTSEKYKDKEYLDILILNLSKNYSSILHKKTVFNRHFNIILIWHLNLIIFSIIYLSIVIFEDPKRKLIRMFNLADYFSVMFFLCLLTYYNFRFLNSVSI